MNSKQSKLSDPLKIFLRRNWSWISFGSLVGLQVLILFGLAQEGHHAERELGDGAQDEVRCQWSYGLPFWDFKQNIHIGDIHFDDLAIMETSNLFIPFRVLLCFPYIDYPNLVFGGRNTQKLALFGLSLKIHSPENFSVGESTFESFKFENEDNLKISLIQYHYLAWSLTSQEYQRLDILIIYQNIRDFHKRWRNCWQILFTSHCTFRSHIFLINLAFWGKILLDPGLENLEAQLLGILHCEEKMQAFGVDCEVETREHLFVAVHLFYCL